VLRGPQGTLFGRNATGGLINIITRDPHAGFSANGGVSYGNFDTFEGTFYATGGSDVLSADVALYAIDQGKGYGHYVNLPDRPEANFRKDRAGRSKVMWRPSDADRLTLSFDWSNSPSDIGLSRTAVPGSVLLGKVPAVGTIYDSMGGTRAQHLLFENKGASVRYERDLGSATLTFIDGYRKFTIEQFYDQDSQPARFADVFQRNRTKSNQAEGYVSGTTGPLKWTTGVFVFSSKAQGYPLSISGANPASNTDLFATQQTNSYAIYGEGTYAITDATHVTAGLRYTQDEHQFSGRRVATVGNTVAVGTVLQNAYAENRNSEPTWRFSLDHQLTETVLGYVSYNRGFKSGTYNLSNITAPPVGPEKLDAYEVGLKSELFEHVLRLNGAAFYYNYKGIQITTVQAGVASFFNAAKSEIKGAEFEATFAPRMPIGNLTLTSGLALLHAKYTCFDVACGGSPGQINTPLPTGGNLQTSGSLTGNTLIRAPKWTLEVRGDYTIPVGRGELGLSASAYHNDGFYWEPDNRLKQDPYDLVNAEISYAFGSLHQYRVRIFGTNLLDEKLLVQQQENSFGDTGVPGAPRLYGVGFNMEF
jgi:iron complex outermembrane receptor protein